METSTDPRGAGRADAEGRGMAMSGPPRRTHIHAVHASSRHPWKERRNVAGRGDGIAEHRETEVDKRIQNFNY